MSGVMPPEPPPPSGEFEYGAAGGGRRRPQMNGADTNRQALTIQDVKQQLVALSPDIARSLPPGVSAERFTTVSLTAIQNTPKLLQCDPQSLFNACLKAAQDGLLPDGREGVIVPRYNKTSGQQEASWQPMVAGIQAKAKRRGNVVSLPANVVYEGEVWEVLLGDEERITHKRDVSKVERGKEIAVYAIATMKDGSKEREVMSWSQVQAVRQASGDPNSMPWTRWPDEMARKTVIRRLSKRLPSLDDGDDDLQRSIERVDELYPFGKTEAPPTLEAAVDVAIDEPEAPAPAPQKPLKQDGGANEAFRGAGLPPKVTPATSGHLDEPFDPETGELADTWLPDLLHALATEPFGKGWVRHLRIGLEQAPSNEALTAITNAPTVGVALGGKASPATRVSIHNWIDAAGKRIAAEVFPDGPPDDSTDVDKEIALADEAHT